MDGINSPGNSAVSGPELAAWQCGLRLRALARLHETPARPPRWLRIGALALLLVLHGAVLIALREAMFAPRPGNPPVVEVELIEFSSEPALPEPVPPQVPARRTPQVTTVRPPPPRETLPLPVEASQPRLFNPDGSIVLPNEPSPPPADSMTATFSEPVPSPDIGIMQHKRPLKVRPNHFEAAYAELHTNSVLNDFVARNLTFTQEFVLPWGTHVKCAEVFVIVAAGGACGWYTPYPYYVPRERWKPASVLDEQ